MCYIISAIICNSFKVAKMDNYLSQNNISYVKNENIVAINSIYDTLKNWLKSK